MVKSKAQISWSNRQSFQQAINSLLYLEANGIIFIPEWMWANLNPIARYQLATNFPKQTRDRLRELTAALRTPRKLTLTLLLQEAMLFHAVRSWTQLHICLPQPYGLVRSTDINGNWPNQGRNRPDIPNIPRYTTQERAKHARIPKHNRSAGLERPEPLPILLRYSTEVLKWPLSSKQRMKTSSATKSHSPSTVEGERKTTSTKRWLTGQQTRKRG